MQVVVPSQCYVKANPNAVTFSYAEPRNRRPRARFVKIKRGKFSSNTISFAKIEVFDYSGVALRPIKSSSDTESILYDFGIEREIAGVKVTNLPGSLGAINIGCSVQVLTSGGVAVFGVRLRDNRLVYSIRTCPPSPEAKLAQYLRNSQLTTVPYFPCCPACCSITVSRRDSFRYQERLAIDGAMRSPGRQDTVISNVDFAAPIVGRQLLTSPLSLQFILMVVVGGAQGANVAAYNDPPSRGGYMPVDSTATPESQRAYTYHSV